MQAKPELCKTTSALKRTGHQLEHWNIMETKYLVTYVAALFWIYLG